MTIVKPDFCAVKASATAAQPTYLKDAHEAARLLENGGLHDGTANGLKRAR